MPFAAHPHVTDQRYLVSWNNKQAPAWSAADNQWAYGSVFRSELISDRIKADLAHGHKMTIAQLVQAMDLRSTEDIRAVEVLPIVFKALGKPRSTKLRAAIAELRAWYRAGGFRRGTNASSGSDRFTPTIELLDAWWPKLVSSEFKPMLGARVQRNPARRTAATFPTVASRHERCACDAARPYSAHCLRR